jgi:hypothetical protein
VDLDEQRLCALAPGVELGPVRDHLRAFEKVCQGAEDGGPIARLTQRERFHWLVSPRSTVIQVSPVHAGLCENPEETLEQLFRGLVLVAPNAA